MAGIWYATKPELFCSNPYFENFYRYRWDNLQMLTFAFFGQGGSLPYPGIYEGTGNYQKHISYSAQAHMREVRWLESPELAQGSILNFLANQSDDGSFPGHIEQMGAYKNTFYHADWGSSVWETYLMHRDVHFLQVVYPGLVRYAQYFQQVRDPEKIHLYDVVNHYETGQEYSSRYSAVDPLADKENWGNVFRIKGVDATVYIYQLYKALAKIASVLGQSKAVKFWQKEACETKQAIRDFMWDSEMQMFFDLDPHIMQRTRVKALTCFYPYFTDIVSKRHLLGFKEHLFNPREFLTPFPFPTLSQDDPHFSSDGFWRGVKRGCPWNGRVWPMTNSHIAEAIARCAIRFSDQELRDRFVEFFNRWIQIMMFFDKTPRYPNSFEHYLPIDGSPSTKENGFNGINNYLHSWINDLIIKYVAGFRPRGDGTFVIDPFPFGIDLALTNLRYGSNILSIKINNGLIDIKKQRVR